MGQIHRLHKLSNEIKDDAFHLEISKALLLYSESFALRIGVHSSLFQNVIQMLGSKQQQDEWIHNINELRMIGCFAMVKTNYLFLSHFLTEIMKRPN